MMDKTKIRRLIRDAVKADTDSFEGLIVKLAEAIAVETVRTPGYRRYEKQGIESYIENALAYVIREAANKIVDNLEADDTIDHDLKLKESVK